MAVVDKNKLLGTTEKGGELAVRPTTSLVGSSGGKITKTSDEKDVVYTISTKLVKVDKFLKGNLDAEKAAQKKEQKQKEDELRAEQEQDKEKPDKKQEKETPKQLIPKMSFLDGIKKFLGDVLVGWLTFRLIKFLPKIVKLLKPIAAFADFVIDVGGKLLDGLVSFIDWGYKAVEGTKGWIGEKFGEGAAEKFDSFMGTLTRVMNLVFAVGLASSAMGLGDIFDNKRRKKPKTKTRKPQDVDIDGKPRVKPKPKPKAKWKINLQKWWKNTPVGKFLRNAAAIRKKLIRTLQQNSKRIVQNLGDVVVNNKTVKNITNIVTEIVEDPQKIIKAVTENKTVQTVIKESDKLVKEGLEKSKKVIENIKNIDLQKTIQNINNSDLAKKIKSVIPKGDSTKTGWFSKVKGNLGDGFKWIKEGTVSNFNKGMQKAAELGSALNKKWKSITSAASEGFSKLSKAGQEVLAKKILQPLMGFLEPVLKPLVAAKDVVLNKLSKIMPEGILKKVGVATLADAPKMVGELGAKAIPWIGGLFNILFAYERYANEDFVGGSLEALAAGLDLAGATWPASLSVDLYLLARDMFPETIMGQESDIIGMIPGGAGLQSSLNKFAGKLPKVDDLTKMITGLFKDESVVNAGDGSTETSDMTNLLTTDDNSVTDTANIISTEASYEGTGQETIVVRSGSEQDTTGDGNNNESLTAVVVGGNNGGNDEVGELLYKG